MEPRTVRSRPNMTQEEALISLQRTARKHKEEIISFRRQGNTWVAQLRVAEFPPSDDSESGPPDDDGPPKEESSDSESSDDSGDDGGSPDGPPSPGDPSADGHKGEEKGELHLLVSLVEQIADKLGIVPGGGDHMLPPGDEPAGPMPPAPPGGGDSGMGSAGKSGPLPTKLHPGEVLPHQTPVGSPAFASKKSFTIKANVKMSATQAMTELNGAYGPQGYEVKELAPQKDGTYAAMLVAK